jgi:hypothetical protein
MTNELDTMCACGHKAVFHPSLESQREYWKANGGRYTHECHGAGQPPESFMSAHCHCVTTREEVINAEKRSQHA